MMSKGKAIAITIIIIIFIIMLILWQKANSQNEIVSAKPKVKYKIGQPHKIATSASPVKNAFKVAQARNKPVEFALDPAQYAFRDQSDFEAWAAGQLRTIFDQGNLPEDNYAFLMGFRDYIKTHFPEDWHSILDEILQIAVPKHIRQINKIYKKIDEYDAWFDSNRNLLATMTFNGIKAAIWQKREELFGEGAANIWNADSRTEQLQDMIAVFNNASHITIKDKLQVFENFWNDISIHDNTDMSDQVHKYHMAFMDLDSVQVELAQMGAAKRMEMLALIRKAMGYDDAKIEEMMNFDAYEDQQWETGRRYMSERDEIVKQFSGGEREQRLRLLREHYFKQEANVIATEEASNYFRFKQKRVYGHN